MNQEVWAAVPGYEGAYEVSNLGRVQSLPGGLRWAKVLKQTAAGRGYLTNQLCVAGVIRRFYVHHLVAAAFIGPRPEGLDVCHNNGNFLDNRAENLRYDTVSGNMRDSLTHGTHASTRQTHCKQGHELSPDNLYHGTRVSADGGVGHKRICRQCMLDAQQRYRNRKRLLSA